MIIYIFLVWARNPGFPYVTNAQKPWIDPWIIHGSMAHPRIMDRLWDHHDRLRDHPDWVQGWGSLCVEGTQKFNRKGHYLTDNNINQPNVILISRKKS